MTEIELRTSRPGKEPTAFYIEYATYPQKERMTCSQGMLSLSKCKDLNNGTLFDFGSCKNTVL
jgi:hypothetical protein